MVITSKGFQFLLEDTNTQLWNLLLKYLESAEEREMDLVEVLSFLFMLGSLELGRVRRDQAWISRTRILRGFLATGLLH